MRDVRCVLEIGWQPVSRQEGTSTYIALCAYRSRHFCAPLYVGLISALFRRFLCCGVLLLGLYTIGIFITIGAVYFPHRYAHSTGVVFVIDIDGTGLMGYNLCCSTAFAVYHKA